MPLPDATQVSGAVPAKELGKEDILLELQDDVKPEKEDGKEIQEPPGRGKEEIREEKQNTEGEDSEEEADNELAEIEAELKADEEIDEEELVVPVPRAAILKKFPIWKEIVKEFPFIEKSIYREKQFSEVFPTPKDAKEASEKAATLDEFESSLLEGNLERVLKSVKDESNESFTKIADNYLLAMSKVDERAYHHVVGNIIKSTIYNMRVVASKSTNENTKSVLQNAASLLNQFVFGSDEFEAPSRLSKEETTEKSQKEIELEKREEDFRKRAFETARNGLDNKVDKRLKSIISQNLDPKESMTEYIRTRAEKDVLQDCWTQLEKNPRFKVLKDRLWENAYKNDYDDNSMGKIETAIISMAKTLLPSVIKKARTEALKGMGKRVTENNEAEEVEQEPAPTRRESTSPRQSRQPAKRGEIPAGMSNKDYIMSD